MKPRKIGIRCSIGEIFKVYAEAQIKSKDRLPIPWGNYVDKVLQIQAKVKEK